MAVRLIFFTSLIFIRLSQALDDLPEGSCHNDHLLRGRIGCINLQGHIQFDANKFLCTLEKYGSVERVDGVIEFVNGTYFDPLACMPRLYKIFMPEESQYKNLVPLSIGGNVKKMGKFTFNESLAIFNPYKKQNGIYDVVIESKEYVMDFLTHRKLMSVFGSARVRVANSKGNGECLFTVDRPLKYLTNLDDCIEIRGNLIIDSSLVLPKTRTRLQRIKGCIRIENTGLMYNQLEFLRHVTEIRCTNFNETIIKGNKNLCITRAFADHLLSIHVNITAKDDKEALKKQWMEENANSSFCAGVCTTHSIEEETHCTTIWGELTVFEKYVDKLANVSTIYGRLIIDGFNAEEPFKYLPKLTKIISTTKEPAVKITSNTKLKWINFPENLEIDTPGQFRIYIDRNLHYRMNKTQYVQLAEKYGAERLNIKHLAENECYFTTPITDFEQLDGCNIIVGDFILNGKINGTPNETQIAFITGCIIINGTDLRDLDFLRMLNDKSSQECRSGHVITHNKNLCANKYVRRLTVTRSHTGFYRITTHSNKPYCYKTCIREDVYQGRLECTYVDDRMMIPTDGTDDFLSYATNVEHLHGTLSIRYTNVTRINSFSHLKSFTLHDDEPAIEIVDNKHLKSVAFPRLDKIKPAKNSTAKLIVIKKNGNYIMPAKQYKRLENKYGADNLDIDHFELPDFYGYGMAVGIACGTVLGVLCLIAVLGVFLHRQVRKKKTVAKKKEEQKPLIGRDEYEQGANGAAVSVMPPVPAQELTPQDMESMMKGNQEEYIDLAGPEMNEKSSLVTANTANKLDGALKVNASMMQREREANKTKVVRSDEDDTKGPMTVRTANFGKNFAGNPKDNVSRMSTEKGTSKGKSDGDDERGPATARTANVGMNKYSGAQKENVSRMNTEQLGNKGALSRSMDSKDRGTLTARTANIGKNYAGAPKENMSLMQKEKTVTKAKSDSDDLGPATARTANIGGGKFVGAPKNTASQMQKEKNSEEKGPETAMTANIGMGKKFEKGNQSVFKNDATAKTGYLPGNKEFTGNIKENKSVMGKAKNEKSPDKKK